MKRVLTILLVLLLVFQIGCGAEDETAEVSPTANGTEEFLLEETKTPEPEQSPEVDGPVLVLPDPWAFLGGSTLSEEETATAGSKKLTFELKPEEDVLALQYVDLLLSGAYEVKKVEIMETESDTAHAYACYFDYTGEGEIPVLDMGRSPCRLFIGIRRDEGEKTTFALIYPKGVGFADMGERADRSVMESETEPAPAPSSTTTPAPSTAPAPDKKDPSVIPDFLANDPSGAFRAGTSAFDHAVCFLADDDTYFYAAEAYVQLLLDMGYRITGTSEKSGRTYSRYQWNLYHDGVDSSTIEDDTHVRVKHLSKKTDDGAKTEISIGYGVGITYGGEEQYGGGSGGSSGGGTWDPYVPDHSKLPCLDCDGSGDCDECGGYGYVGFGSARAACGKCHRSGDCRTCGGSGTR